MAKQQKRVFPEIPLSASPAIARATLVGKGRLYIENHDGLLEVGDKRIRVRTRFGELIVEGMDLVLDTDGAGMVCIGGRIASLLIAGVDGDA